ncbi:MAG: hypothetical protein ABIM40_14250 [Pseudomonadota bacterium]
MARCLTSLFLALALLSAGMPALGGKAAFTGSLDLAEAVVSLRDLAGSVEAGGDFPAVAAQVVVRMRAAAGLDAAWSQALENQGAGQHASLWMGLAPPAAWGGLPAPASPVQDTGLLLTALLADPPEPPPDIV